MKVVLTIASLDPQHGGPSRSVPALAVALARQNVSVQVVTCSCRGDSAEPVLPVHENINTVLIAGGAPNAMLIGASGAFRLAVQKCCNSADTVVHDNGLWLGTNHAAAQAARAANTPLIVSPRGMLTPWALKFRAWKKKLAWWLYQQRDLKTARVLHATSQDEADGFRVLGFTQPIAIVPNGVILPPEYRKSEIGNRKSEMRTALFLSRIHPKKGLLDLVKAWAKVSGQWSVVGGPCSWRIVVAGGNEGGHLEEVKAEIGKQKLEASFDFIGDVADEKKWEVYQNADVFVLPTRSENFGIVIAEALASGLPVITTKGAPWSELITHRCGWWVDIGVEPLVVALREALQLTDEQRRELGERGRQLVEQKYTWPVAAGQMAAVYGWMLGQGEKPDCVQTS